jgi:hypothetical protein
MVKRQSFTQITVSILLAAILALSACATIPATPTATPKPSRLPDPNDVKALLVQLVDVEKELPGS